MPKKIHLSILIILLAISLGCRQSGKSPHQQVNVQEDPIDFVQIKTDSIFSSHQIISFLTISKKALDSLRIEFGYSQTALKPTSLLAKSENALAAINGGFFNMDDGGSVTYFEVNDTVVSRTRNPDLKWAVTDSLMNGAIVLRKNSEITIESVHSEQFYETSKQEAAVLVTGPVLLMDSVEMALPDMKFTNNRHPRTCFCINKESILLITIDGRNKEAEGMNLFETQQFLQSIGCVDAINLDGGGSTTMWIKNKGVVNFPSDQSGERPVANILFLKNKQ